MRLTRLTRESRTAAQVVREAAESFGRIAADAEDAGRYHASEAAEYQQMDLDGVADLLDGLTAAQVAVLERLCDAAEARGVDVVEAQDVIGTLRLMLDKSAGW